MAFLAMLTLAQFANEFSDFVTGPVPFSPNVATGPYSECEPQPLRILLLFSRLCFGPESGLHPHMGEIPASVSPFAHVMFPS
jgi:hypothetical protein